MGKATRIAGAIVAGITGGWFIIFFGKNLPLLFGFEPSFHPGENFLMLSILGFMFGYYVGKTIERSHILFVFISSLLGYCVSSILLNLPPIFLGGMDPTFSMALIVPFIFSISAYFSIFKEQGAAREWYERTAGKVFWYFFLIHVAYVYEYPLAMKLVLMLREKVLDIGLMVGFIILTGLLLSMFLAIRFATRRISL